MDTASASSGPRDLSRFELTGGMLCLDFVNTVSKRPTDESEELLATYEDLVQWAEAAGAVAVGDARVLARQGRKRPGEAEAVLQQARQLREALFALLKVIVSGLPVPQGPLECLNQWLGTALAELRLEAAPGCFVWTWRKQTAPLDRPLWAIARSAADLLTSDRLERLRVCASDRCDWLFLDGSKNGTRRWCDMAVCGNRAKARRHREAAKTHRQGRSS